MPAVALPGPSCGPASPQASAPLGVALALLGVALFTPVFAASKLAGLWTGFAAPALGIMAMRYLGGFAVALSAAALRPRGSPPIRSAEPWTHALRALFGAGGGALAIHAASLLPVADAAAIGLTKGLLIVALAAIVLREPVTARHWLAGALCALGAWFVIRAAGAPDAAAAASDRSLEGALAAFGSALCIAVETLMIRVLARREAAIAMLVYVNGFGALLTVGPGLWAFADAGAPWPIAVAFLLLGPLAILGQYCNILAYRRADASVLGPIGYSWILFSTALGYLCFDEVPGPGAALGAAMIAAGGAWLSLPPRGPRRAEETQQAHAAAIRPRPAPRAER
ncbi:MAG: DMT family transporter [Pseudomonadota bacterium]